MRHAFAVSFLAFYTSLCAGIGHDAFCADGDAEAMFPPPQRNHVTFWGHSCSYIDVDGFGIVTDPVFAGRYVFRRRKIPVPPEESRAGARLILVSHAHMDHFHAGSVAMFPDSAVVLCPYPVAEYLEETGRLFVIMEPGDVYEYPHGKVHAVHAEHPAGRYAMFGDSEEGGAIGFVVTSPYGSVYYSGDTRYFDGMADIGSRFRPDIAIINFSPHLRGAGAIRAAWATRARTVIPSHFGAYDYILFGPLGSPRGYGDIVRMIEDQAVLLQPGESVPIDHKPGEDADQNPNPRRE